jgi:hypothetical protein
VYVVYIQIMEAIISATEARKRFFEILDWTEGTDREVVIERDGKSVVKISGTMNKSNPELLKLIADFKKKCAKIGTPVARTKKWRDKEARYLRDLSKKLAG